MMKFKEAPEIKVYKDRPVIPTEAWRFDCMRGYKIAIAKQSIVSVAVKFAEKPVNYEGMFWC